MICTYKKSFGVPKLKWNPKLHYKKSKNYKRHIQLKWQQLSKEEDQASKNDNHS